MSELNYWNGRLLRGAISRREFMGRAAALGASSLAISTMLASADALAADTPKNGGLLRLGLGGGSTTDSIDVTSYNDSVMIDVAPGLFNGLSNGARTASRIRSSPRALSRRTARRTGSSISARGSSSRTARSSLPTTPSIR